MPKENEVLYRQLVFECLEEKVVDDAMNGQQGPHILSPLR